MTTSVSIGWTAWPSQVTLIASLSARGEERRLLTCLPSALPGASRTVADSSCWTIGSAGVSSRRGVAEVDISGRHTRARVGLTGLDAAIATLASRRLTRRLGEVR